MASASTVTLNLNKFECPVCLEIPEDEVYQCPEGHVLCGECYASTQCKCPQCRITFDKTRNRALEDLLDSLELPCEHKALGCKAKLNRKNARIHNESCNYRQTVLLCQKMGFRCSFQSSRGKIRAIVDHFKACHQFQECSLGSPISILFPDFYRPQPCPEEKTLWRPMLIKIKVGDRRRPDLYMVVFGVVDWAAKNFSVDCIDLGDLLGAEEMTETRIQFSIKSQKGKAPLIWSVCPYPSTKCNGLVNQQTFRISVAVLKKEYLGKETTLNVECKVSKWRSYTASSSQSGTLDEISVTAERVTSILAEEPALPISWETIADAAAASAVQMYSRVPNPTRRRYRFNYYRPTSPLSFHDDSDGDSYDFLNIGN